MLTPTQEHLNFRVRHPLKQRKNNCLDPPTQPLLSRYFLPSASPGIYGVALLAPQRATHLLYWAMRRHQRVTHPSIPGSYSFSSVTRLVASTDPVESAQATQTTFDPPPGDIGLKRVHPFYNSSTRVAYPPISNIATPQTPLLAAVSSASGGQDFASSPTIDDVEMKDTTPIQEITPLGSTPDKQSATHDKTGQTTGRQATIEDDHEDSAAEADSSPTPSRPNRAKLSPKRPQDCRRKAAPETQYVRPGYASKVVWETFTEDDPMPKGYLGTIGGIRICQSLPEDYSPCGFGGGHHLICGHEVISSESCGMNCKNSQYHAAGFDCSQCRDIVWDILNNKLTKAEQDKIDFYHMNGHPLAIALCVEYITKYTDGCEGSITEIVMCVLNKNWGRECLAYITVSDEEEPKTLKEMFEKNHDSLEQKTRNHLARQSIEPLASHDKRKTTPEEEDVSSSAPKNVKDTRESSDAASALTESNKKRKTKLETHREPITQETRGKKRNTPELDSNDSSYDADSAESGPLSKKKLKQKLKPHPEPTTPNTRGKKRERSSDSDYSSSFEYSASFRSNKRATITSPPNFGEASFITPPPSVLGPLLRKRDQDVHLETALDVESNKRRRREEAVLPGQDEKLNVFVKKRASLADMAPPADDDEL
ncbi:hypothetical protein EK21DRAFT_116024 [Setomelanomma holmii]|uniref:Uncharacterized protein n=1 Tax=Setomelanomma holmii TaxID=210430 RepID=A0A9P4LJ55_9PLEO|nr:hypothetical protein EK21DRAFT_116024 [Setomelanomma holmii]